MTDLADLEHIPPIQVFEGVRVRRVQGDLVTLAVVELDPHAVVRSTATRVSSTAW